MKNLSMILKLSLLFALFTPLSIQTEILLSCKTDLNCKYQVAYTIFDLAKGQKYTFCTKFCPSRSISTAYDIVKCESDVGGNSCPSKACAILKKLHHCREQKECTTDPYQHQIQCGDCKQENCAKCISKGDNVEVCYGRQTCDFSKISGSYAACPGQPGKSIVPGTTYYPCNCCSTVQFEGKGVGECIDELFFDDEKLKQKASEYITDDGQSSHEEMIANSLRLLVVCIVLFLGQNL